MERSDGRSISEARKPVDCYLCGASNPPDADVCERCDGQLLKIGLDAEFDEDPEVVGDPVLVDGDSDETEPADDEQNRPKKRRQPRLKSLEDSRLEDALGLAGAEDEDDEDDYEPLLIPKAGPAVNIPMIGTRQPVGTVSGIASEKSGRLVYVLLGMLVVAVAWMAYSTLVAGDDGGFPDNLALTNTTVPVETTSTTEPRPRPWSSAEVGGRFGSTFARITLIDCPDDVVEGQGWIPVDEWTVYGVTVNEHSVIAPGSALGTADVATIRSRFGNRAYARISQLPNGILVVTTDLTLNRSLGLVDTPIGEPVYYVSYEDEFATTTVTTERSDIPIEITVTDQGEAIAVRLESRVADLDMLHDVAELRTEVQENPAPISGGTICNDLPYLVDATAPEASPPEEEP